MAVNMVVLGAAPDRVRRRDRSEPVQVTVDGRVVHDGPATGVVVANGEFLRGADVVPRGHPGDGRCEVQVYAVPRRDRAALRTRVRTGTHVPHPNIVQSAGWRVEVDTDPDRAWPLELDGRQCSGTTHLVVELLPQAFVLVT
ncbi:MAG: hypothetical protein ACHQIG_00660 [Acidimicrobiia bacterium]